MQPRASAIPQRHPLAAQVAEILRQRLQSGEWKDALPSERHLCEELQVSRKTIRAALDQLQRQGWLRMSDNRRRIKAAGARRPCASGGSNKIVLLGAKPMRSAEQLLTSVIEQVEKHLHQAGFELELAISPRFALHDCSRTVAKLIGRARAACWILWSVQLETQRWFVERGLPTLVFGSTHRGVALPSVDIDYASAMQHAVNLLLARGHRRIALFCERNESAGDQLTMQGFLDAFRRAGITGAEPRAIHHDGTVAGIGRVMEATFAREEPPTALLVSYPFQVLSVMGHLTRLGLRIPDDVSVVSRDHDSCLEHVVPSIARYSCDPSLFARKLSRLTMRLARGEPTAPIQVRIMPGFVSGQSVASPQRRCKIAAVAVAAVYDRRFPCKPAQRRS